MNTSTQKAKAIQFRQMHTDTQPLVLPNAWDAASASIFFKAGFRAIATTSSGVAAAFGYTDGQHIHPDMMIEAIAHIARSGDAANRVQQAIQRLNAYREAGADSLFPIGVSDADTIARLLQAVHGPINCVQCWVAFNISPRNFWPREPI